MDLVQSVAQAAGPRSRTAGGRRRHAKGEQRLMLAEAINELSETERLVLGMRCLEAVRPHQIALLLDQPEEKINALLESGMRVVREHLTEARSAPSPRAGSPSTARVRCGGGRAR